MRDRHPGGRPAGRADGGGADRLRARLADLHDAYEFVDWVGGLADDGPGLAGAAGAVVTTRRAEAAAVRKGWRAELKQVDQRWRRWRG